MKKIFSIGLLCAIVFAGCRKEPRIPVQKPVIPSYPIPPAYLSKIKTALAKELNQADYSAVDFSNFSVSKQKAAWHTRLGFNNKNLAGDFILLQTDSTANILVSKIIHLEKTVATAGVYNGKIEIYSGDRKTVTVSAITNGFIEAFHPKIFSAEAKEAIIPMPIIYDYLPEVIVVGYNGSSTGGGGLSWSDYMSLQNLINSGGGGGASSGNGSIVFSPLGSGGSGGSYNGGSNGNNGTATPAPTGQGNTNLDIFFEDSYYKPAIDLDAWIKCFTDIPDAGAVCSVTLCADLPIDDDPTATINFYTGATGHCFLQFKKTNGAKSITQIIGFTSTAALHAITNPSEFVPSKLVDNAGHKYDASITMNITPTSLATVIAQMKTLAGTPYSILRFDCLDFGLSVINSIRAGDPLVLPFLPNPTSPFQVISTGERLYNLLENMKFSGHPEANNIFVGGAVYAGASHGPCN